MATSTSLGGPARRGLERSCEIEDGWLRTQHLSDGVEAMQAWFGGRGFEPHRHATYGICVTDVGVQRFAYRGNSEISLRGDVVVLHPDEAHDGGPGAEGGFGYRIVYVEPALIAQAAQAIRSKLTALPFARQPVSRNRTLAKAVASAFSTGTEQLALDSLVLSLAEGLLQADAVPTPAPRIDQRAVGLASAFLDANTRVVRSSELEAVSGLNRYELARQFRAVHGTSPYRYSVLRRLGEARRLILRERVVDAALQTGFADQAHFTRVFRATYGMPPGRYLRLQRAY